MWFGSASAIASMICILVKYYHQIKKDIKTSFVVPKITITDFEAIEETPAPSGEDKNNDDADEEEQKTEDSGAIGYINGGFDPSDNDGQR